LITSLGIWPSSGILRSLVKYALGRGAGLEYLLLCVLREEGATCAGPAACRMETSRLRTVAGST
jgi:hypothetical protein